MKKIVFTLVALMSMTMGFAESGNKNSENTVNVEANAADAENSDAEKYIFNININSLGHALRLDFQEKDAVSFIADDFSRDMAKAGAATGEEREKLYKKALVRNISNMHYILSDRQYSKYAQLLNATINNRGLNK